MSTYKLYYFDLRSRAEVVRLIFARAGQEFEDVRFDLKNDMDKFKSEKDRYPYGQVPALEVDGEWIGETRAIERFVARRCGLMGDTDIEQAHVDEILQVVDSLMEVYESRTKMHGDEKKEKLDDYFTNFLPYRIQKLEKRLEDNKKSSEFLVGKGLTAADIGIYYVLNDWYRFDYEEFHYRDTIASLLDKAPRLQKLVTDTVPKADGISKWLQERKQTVW